MNIKVKSSLIIIGTFVLGMLIGSIFTRSFFRPPEMGERIRELRKPEGFMENFERIIEPTDAQREKIREILRLHFERMHKNSKEFRERFIQLNDSLRAELDPVLSDEQKARLDEMEKRFRDHERPEFGPPRPPRPQREFPDRRDSKRN
jgi:hypothetical protein